MHFSFLYDIIQTDIVHHIYLHLINPGNMCIGSRKKLGGAQIWLLYPSSDDSFRQFAKPIIPSPTGTVSLHGYD